jgi:DNA mismatch repair protein MutH
MMRSHSSSYNPSSIESIFEYSLSLVGKTLASVVELPPEVQNFQDKGNLGSLVEQYFFGLNKSNHSGPDFKKAGLELKTTGLKKDRAGEYVAKERLKLGSINYSELENEDWTTSAIFKKIKIMLILFYEYDENVNPVDRKFIASILYRIPMEDQHQIRQDWEKVREKVRQGKAHELSEGDTKYLGACRSGSGGINEPKRKQPKSDIEAQSRAFCFKQSYLTGIYRQAPADQVVRNHSKLVSLGASEFSTIEKITEARFQPFFGKSVDEIAVTFGVSNDAKHFRRLLAEKILGGSDVEVAELLKAGIKLKTIKLGTTWTPKEAMSFKNFDYFEIASQEWAESQLSNDLEREFLFVIFREIAGVERLESIVFWNMPFGDLERAREVWELTKQQILQGAREFTRASERRVIHVRPKAARGSDLVSTPKSGLLGKKCFWINAGYIGEQLKMNMG